MVICSSWNLEIWFECVEAGERVIARGRERVVPRSDRFLWRMGEGFDSGFLIGCLSLKVNELIAEEMIVGLGCAGLSRAPEKSPRGLLEESDEVASTVSGEAARSKRATM